MRSTNRTTQKNLRAYFGHLAFAGVLCLASFANAQESTKINPARNNISSADRVALTLIDMLPESGVKSGLQRYYSILSPGTYNTDSELAVSNAGLARFFEQQFQRNSCFAEKSFLFYRDLRKNIRDEQADPQSSERHRRASLGDVAGKNRKDLKPGWLFEKALQYTNNNPNAAISLIGLCGHDDTKQGHFVNPEVSESLIASGISEDELHSPPGDEPEIQSVCPSRYSDFYIAGALSQTSDISESLKKDILKIQYPGKSPLQIASKNYHVLGAAFMTCQMIEAGLNPLVAIQVESMAASLYRGIRLCQSIETPAHLFWSLQKHRDLILIPMNTSFEALVVDKAIEKGRSKICTTKKIREDVFCALLNSAGIPFDLTNPLIEKNSRYLLERYVERMIAAGIYSSWHISGQVAGISLPCSKEQFWGPHSFMQWLVSNTNIHVNICGNGLSMEACRRAVKMVKTWEIDFDWTVAQHTAGARFAARVCKAYPEGRNSFADFCENK